MNNWFIATLPAFPGFYDSFLYDPDMENAAAVENAELIPDRYLFPADILNSLFWMYDKAYTFDFEGYKKAAASAYAPADGSSTMTSQAIRPEPIPFPNHLRQSRSCRPAQRPNQATGWNAFGGSPSKKSRASMASSNE